jgi:hypothetical protein
MKKSILVMVVIILSTVGCMINKLNNLKNVKFQNFKASNFQYENLDLNGKAYCRLNFEWDDEMIILQDKIGNPNNEIYYYQREKTENIKKTNGILVELTLNTTDELKKRYSMYDLGLKSKNISNIFEKYSLVYEQDIRYGSNPGKYLLKKEALKQLQKIDWEISELIRERDLILEQENCDWQKQGLG